MTAEELAATFISSSDHDGIGFAHLGCRDRANPSRNQDRCVGCKRVRLIAAEILAAEARGVAAERARCTKIADDFWRSWERDLTPESREPNRSIAANIIMAAQEIASAIASGQQSIFDDSVIHEAKMGAAEDAVAAFIQAVHTPAIAAERKRWRDVAVALISSLQYDDGVMARWEVDPAKNKSFRELIAMVEQYK